LGNDLIPIWKHFQKQLSGKNLKEFKNQAEEFFIQALHATEKGHIEQGKQFLSHIIQLFNETEDQLFTASERQQQQLLLHYQILLNQEKLLISSLQKLVEEKNHLTSPLTAHENFQEASQDLVKSLDQLKNQHPRTAKLFLLHSFYLVQTLFEPEETLNLPPLILDKALNQAHHALLLNQLAQFENVNSLQSDIQLILNTTQRQTIESAKPFIDSVIAIETKRFRQTGGDHKRCEQTPWNQAIPLFEKGYQAAQLAFSYLSPSSFRPLEATVQQEKTIIYWQQALQLLEEENQENEKQENEAESPPQPNTEEPNQAPASVNEILELIQEMHTADQPMQTETPKEWHSW